MTFHRVCPLRPRRREVHQAELGLDGDHSRHCPDEHPATPQRRRGEVRQRVHGDTGEHATCGRIKGVEAATLNVEAPDGSASDDRRSAAHAALRDPPDRVFSVVYQVRKMTVRASAKNAVDTRYGMPSPMWRTSAAMVPKTATMATASQ